MCSQTFYVSFERVNYLINRIINRICIAYNNYCNHPNVDLFNVSLSTLKNYLHAVIPQKCRGLCLGLLQVILFLLCVYYALGILFVICAIKSAVTYFQINKYRNKAQKKGTKELKGLDNCCISPNIFKIVE